MANITTFRKYPNVTKKHLPTTTRQYKGENSIRTLSHKGTPYYTASDRKGEMKILKLGGIDKSFQNKEPPLKPNSNP